MNYLTWGKLISLVNGVITLEYNVYDMVYTIVVDMSSNSGSESEGVKHTVEVRTSSLEGDTIFTFVDEMSTGYNSFTRTIGNHMFVYKGGELVIKYELKNVNYISETSACDSIDTKVITLNIETRVMNSKVTPYCICLFDGVESKSYYLLDYSSVQEMIDAALSNIFTAKAIETNNLNFETLKQLLLKIKRL